MRFQKAETLFRVALAMQGTAEGLSLKDIAAEADCGRRSAERLRDAIERVFPAMQQANPGENPKRWRLPPGTISGLISLSAEEHADLATAAALLKRENLDAQAQNLLAIAAKLRALSRPQTLARIAPDVEALIEAEGLAARPGPRPKLRPEIITALREAILACRKVRVHNLYRVSGKRGYQTVHPYGFLYGNRHYLVAWNESEKVRDFRNYALANIERVEVLDDSFRRRKFSLADYAGQSFGIFHETPEDVVWKFSAKAAPDAAQFFFHPTQVFEPQPDGSLIVRFRSGGFQEMAWHAATWMPELEIVAPAKLRDMLRELAAAITAQH